MIQGMIEELNMKLSKGPVKFTYTKKDGETRHAYGTKSPSYIVNNFGEDKLPSGTGVTKTGVTPYFDLDKQAWRSLRDESLVSIDDNEDEGELNLI